MCKIIEFKPRQRNGYLNLKEFVGKLYMSF